MMRILYHVAGPVIFAVLLVAGAAHMLKQNDAPPLQSPSSAPVPLPPLGVAFQQRLNDALPADCAGRFTVGPFFTKPDAGRILAYADIRLDWPPGLRRRALAARGANDQAAVDALLIAGFARFETALTGCN